MFFLDSISAYIVPSSDISVGTVEDIETGVVQCPVMSHSFLIIQVGDVVQAQCTKGVFPAVLGVELLVVLVETSASCSFLAVNATVTALNDSRALQSIPLLYCV